MRYKYWEWKWPLSILMYYPGIRPEGLRNTMINLILGSRCPGWDSNRTPPEHNSELLPLELTRPSSLLQLGAGMRRIHTPTSTICMHTLVIRQLWKQSWRSRHSQGGNCYTVRFLWQRNRSMPGQTNSEALAAKCSFSLFLIKVRI